MGEILITGGSSFVASKAIEGSYFSSHKLLLPSQKELDITDLNSVRDYVKNADVVINIAAFTDVKNATLELSGPAWNINVKGVANLAKACKDVDKFLIHFSTDGVFPIANNSKGPHSESQQIVDNPNLVSSYGYTKLKGEIEIVKSGARFAILRIAYPFGNARFPEKDYITKLIRSIKLGYALFDDQEFTPTYTRSLSLVLERLLEQQPLGIFHWTCKGVTTPYQIGVYLNDKLNLGLNVKRGYLSDFEKERGKQPYAKFGGLSSEITERILSLEAPTWQESLNEFSDDLL